MRQPQFTFIIPHTPGKYRDALRDKLFEVTRVSMQHQHYPHWQALVVSDNDRDISCQERKIHFLRSAAIGKSDKIKIALDYLAFQAVKPDFLIRLDDDDLISPDILRYASRMEFDCLADKYHHVFDLVSGNLGSRRRGWLPNTVIHRYEHACSFVNGNPLLASQHDLVWHRYYRNKKLVYLPEAKPLYLRIHSPATTTAGRYGCLTLRQRRRQYREYLIRFGRWRQQVPSEFAGLLSMLQEVRKSSAFSSYASFKAASPINRLQYRVSGYLKTMINF